MGKTKPRQPMSLESTEMAVKGFAGIGTVTRFDGENIIVVARDKRALKTFWARWSQNSFDDEKVKKCVVLSLSEFKKGIQSR